MTAVLERPSEAEQKKPTKQCSVGGCDRPARSRGLCTVDYARWWRGDPLGRLREGVTRDYVTERRDLIVETEQTFHDDLTRWDATRARSKKTSRARKRDMWGVGPSDLSACRKEIEYRERPPAGYKPEPEDNAQAALGTIIHEGYARVQRTLYPWRQTEVKVEIPGLDVPGSTDCYDPILGRVDDLKTCGDWKWDRVGKYGPMGGDVEQLLAYMLGLHYAGKYVTGGRLVYVNRKNAAVEEFDIPFDEPRALAAVAKLHRIIEMLDAGVELPRDGRGPTVDGLCRQCPAVKHCWDVDEAEAHGRTPEGWREARDDAGIEWALTTYAEAHQQTLKPNDTKKRMAALVKGAPVGTYGKMIYAVNGGSAGHWELDYEARVEQLEQAMRDGTALDDLVYPQKWVGGSDGRLSIRKVRASDRQPTKKSRGPAKEKESA